MTWPTKVSIELRDIHTFVFLWHGLFVIERRQSSFETGDTSSCKKSIYGRWLLVPLDKYNDKAKGTSCISAKNMCFSCSCILCLFINFIMTIPKNVQFSNHATHRGAAGVLLLLYSFVTVRSLFSQSWPESFEIESQVQRKIFPKAAGVSRVQVHLCSFSIEGDDPRPLQMILEFFIYFAMTGKYCFSSLPWFYVRKRGITWLCFCWR